MAGTNFADLSRFMVGSDTLKITPFYLKTFTIPGISMSHPSLSTRSGTNLKIGADSMDFDTLEMEVLLDSQFSTYFELMDLVFKEVDFEFDSFAMPEFDLWVSVMDSKQKEIFRFDFHHCRINSLGSVSMDPEAELGSTVALSLSYDYYTWERTKMVECCDHQGNPVTQVITETVDRFHKGHANPTRNGRPKELRPDYPRHRRD